jgi:hypothetical protein
MAQTKLGPESFEQHRTLCVRRGWTRPCHSRSSAPLRIVAQHEARSNHGGATRGHGDIRGAGLATLGNKYALRNFRRHRQIRTNAPRPLCTSFASISPPCPRFSRAGPQHSVATSRLEP